MISFQGQNQIYRLIWYKNGQLLTSLEYTESVFSILYMDMRECRYIDTTDIHTLQAGASHSNTGAQLFMEMGNFIFTLITRLIPCLDKQLLRSDKGITTDSGLHLATG